MIFPGFSTSLLQPPVGIRLRPRTVDGASSSNTATSRPRFRKKRNDDNQLAWSVVSEENAIAQVGTRRIDGKSIFTFDHIFEEDTTNVMIYDSMIRPIVWGAVSGRNGTVFCYGQTGSGKTYTIQGKHTSTTKDDGIIFLAAKDIYQWIGESKMKASIRISYFEIYNEQVLDLLSGVVLDDDDTTTECLSKTAAKESLLTVRDDPKRGIQVNCREIEVTELSSLIRIFELGNRGRTVTSTLMNSVSSRSHAIFRITMQISSFDGGTTRSSALNLVDLAGSENSHASALDTKRRIREGGKINTSLLSLSKVIHSLSLPPGMRPKFINYRDSKLTRILQPHLCGNALMSILCCVNAGLTCVEETRSTLRFAARAKLIETKALLNDAETEDCSEMVKKLRHELQATRKRLAEVEKHNVSSQETSKNTNEELNRLKRLMFGDADEESIEPEGSSSEKIRKKRHCEQSVQTVQETDDGSDYLDTKPTFCQLSLASFQRITPSQKDYPPSANSTQIFPSEVLIMTKDTDRWESEDKVSSLQVEHMKQRSKFLESRLEATEDLVEALKKDLKSSRKAMIQLLHKNVYLCSKIEKLNRKRDMMDKQAQQQRRSRYVLLKWSIYFSLVFFIFGVQDLYIVTIMFIWLSLESYTTDSGDDEQEIDILQKLAKGESS
mmetsp:Transcript_4026/g.5792  ORF Transcript_4026/g.5792 Transcript_4026/m.5792 type:complete len:666 (+) Transcript_4026:200-2197(+)|eukprot:CAMPEP_0194203874 /NCGR_PEP_ID=MMETSP0156-20130528/3530_1 /TAXON_ID=33649 /ORGANISM="Thalassionema nitzschioides, Strain L26-B" /LENGTH=665 /DNA_ID=CAMNT_0038929721 /DNA_START=93 /DNA_END=2090 /DNA_ORIENTATION=+